MHKVILSFIIFIAFSAPSYALNSVSRNLETFHSVEVFGNIKLKMVKSDSSYLIISSELFDISKVTSMIENGRLKLKSTGIGDKNEVFITLYFSEIKELSLDASANLVSADSFITESFWLKVAKGSLCQAKFNVTNLDVVVANGGEARIYGFADKIAVNANGGGLLDANKMKISSADLFATSGGKINIKVTEKIDAKARLGGVINYSGNPKVESIDPSSGGKINKL
jgi:hypothetical protein